MMAGPGRNLRPVCCLLRGGRYISVGFGLIEHFGRIVERRFFTGRRGSAGCLLTGSAAACRKSEQGRDHQKTVHHLGLSDKEKGPHPKMRPPILKFKPLG